MPFKNIRVSQPQRSFEAIDRIICAQVFPNIIPEPCNSEHCNYYPILPNGKPSLFFSEAGPMRNQNHREYLALRCLDVGLPYSEIGLWLDECLTKFTVEHADGRTRMITADMESCLSFDRRKPIYYFNGIYRRYILIR